MDIDEKLFSGLFLLGRPGAAVRVLAGALLVMTALMLSACTTGPTSGRGINRPSAADVALVRFSSCGDALRNLRAAARAFRAGVSPASAGTAGSHQATAGAPPAAGAVQGSGASGSGQPGSGAAGGWYSGTNTATDGVDEPDLIKTDGRRIVTISGTVLRVVDAQTGQLTGVLDLSPGTQDGEWLPATLLLAGNHALVLFSQTPYATAVPVMPIYGPRLVLVDLSTGTPHIISDYTIDGSLVDARQTGSVARAW